MVEVLHSQYFVVSISREERLVRVVRSSQPFATIQTVTAAWLEVDAAVARLERKGFSLLVDMRSGPARNDPEFERAIQAIVPQVRLGYQRIGVLVRSAVGRMQVSRVARTYGAVEMVSTNEAEVLEFLRAG